MGVIFVHDFSRIIAYRHVITMINPLCPHHMEIGSPFQLSCDYDCEIPGTAYARLYSE